MILYYTRSYYIILDHTILYYTWLYYLWFYDTLLCCTILYYTTRDCIILDCTLSYYTITLSESDLVRSPSPHGSEHLPQIVQWVQAHSLPQAQCGCTLILSRNLTVTDSDVLGWFLFPNVVAVAARTPSYHYKFAKRTDARFALALDQVSYEQLWFQRQRSAARTNVANDHSSDNDNIDNDEDSQHKTSSSNNMRWGSWNGT